ncbi:MAG: Asp-tRNA(Asn)/Glu-tRNA(Gln) amidotransferase subunit GatA [Candidatus Bathyarchaeia archaeon]
MEPYLLTARETVEKIRSRELTAGECVASVFGRIGDVEDRVHAFVTLTENRAVKRAREVDRKVRRGGGLGRLAGACIAIKDVMCTEGVRTTCSSRMLETFVPPYNATVVERLLAEDAIIIGKTNMDEFAMGSSTETSHFGTTRNPWDLTRVPGGSSGGSAAAVSLDEAIVALGSDTGGSVRCPASFCSVVGLKPTYGLVSRYGLISYANSLEQIGPITEDVYDCALLLGVMAGHDPRDSTSVDAPSKDYTRPLVDDVRGMRVGVPEEFFGEGVDEGVAKVVWDGVHRLEGLGASYEETTLPSLKYALPAYYLIAMSEASSNLARYDGLRYGYRLKEDVDDWTTTFSKSRRVGFGAEVRRRIILGTYALSAGYYDRYYLKALQVRTLIKADFENAFKEFHVLIGPTMPIPPFRIGEKIQDPLAMYMCDILTVPVNLGGYPAISIPCGFLNGLPVGMQLIAPLFREDVLLRVAYTIEQNSPYMGRKPKL